MKWSEVECPDRKYGRLDENEKVIRGAFLFSIGVDLENVSEELFEPCTLYFDEGKKFSKSYEAKVHIRDVVGTKDSRYGGETWMKAFLQEHKAKEHITNGYVTRNKYFIRLKKHICCQQPYIDLIKAKDGKYYVGRNGNHRITFYKLMYLADMAKNEKTLHLYWLYAQVRDEI